MIKHRSRVRFSRIYSHIVFVLFISESVLLTAGWEECHALPPPPSPSNQPGATTGERRLSTSSTPRARPLPSTPMSRPSLRLLLPGKNCRSGCSSALLNLKGVPRLLVVSPALHCPLLRRGGAGQGQIAGEATRFRSSSLEGKGASRPDDDGLFLCGATRWTPLLLLGGIGRR
jgi:hypothetical protein